MDVKQAVAIAKKHLLELFADEKLSNLGLEEVEFNEAGKTWAVTLGFSRPWDEPRNSFAAIANPAASYARRDYKLLRVDAATGEVLSVKTREFKAAA